MARGGRCLLVYIVAWRRRKLHEQTEKKSDRVVEEEGEKGGREGGEVCHVRDLKSERDSCSFFRAWFREM